MKKLRAAVNALDKKSHINREIYGHFSEHLGRCIYNGIFVGEDSSIPNTNGVRNDVIEAFKAIQMPVLRWPGGCFADEYHWRDGIGEKSTRKKMVNTNWGDVTEDNSFGTHEFFNLCEEIGCEPYLAGNVGSGTVQELDNWIEYITFDGVSPLTDLRKKNGREKPWKLKYLGIGNENWGCGGNMTPEHYSNLYRQYQTFCRNYKKKNKLFKIAGGPNVDDYKWTETLMKMIRDEHASGISLHYYTIPSGNFEKKGSATVFTDKEYYQTIKNAVHIDQLITRHLEIMSRHDPKHEIGLIVDEWGNWFDVEKGTNPGFLYQQNTMRDAVTAALNLDIFISHSDRIVMANIAQVVNVLQSVILTEGERMVKTPTYHVFDLYRRHMEGTKVYSRCDEAAYEGAPTLSHSASVKDGELSLTVTNASLTDTQELEITVNDFAAAQVNAEILTAPDVHQHNTFDSPDQVKTATFTDYALSGGKLTVKLPPCSVAAFTLK